MADSRSNDTADAAIEGLQRVLGAGAQFGAPWKLAGGAMHDSWAVDQTGGGKPSELVVRVSPAGRADHEKTRREFEVLRVAHERGIRCPQPIGVGECAGGEDFLVMARETGDANPRQIVAGESFGEARRRLVPQLAEALAAIHTIAPRDVSAAPAMRAPAPGQDCLQFERQVVAEAYELYLLNPHPAIEWAFRWLDRELEGLPSTGREPCVVHGDFRIGNMLYDEQGLTSVLDWEGTHVGEPEEDISWFCTRVWRFGKHGMEAGGIASREGWIRAYEQASGRSISRQRVAAWEVLQNIRWCQITMMQARAHLDGQTNSHELAAIGRRTAETELEILRLTGVAERVAHAG
ncbi:MAG: phosphotransferase family protein [Tepidiformaceae bacterium]